MFLQRQAELKSLPPSMRGGVCVCVCACVVCACLLWLHLQSQQFLKLLPFLEAVLHLCATAVGTLLSRWLAPDPASAACPHYPAICKCVLLLPSASVFPATLVPRPLPSHSLWPGQSSRGRMWEPRLCGVPSEPGLVAGHWHPLIATLRSPYGRGSLAFGLSPRPPPP